MSTELVLYVDWALTEKRKEGDVARGGSPGMYGATGVKIVDWIFPDSRR